MKAKIKRKINTPLVGDLRPALVIRKGTKFITRLVVKTGIPEDYASTVAWFAEHVILAGLCLVGASFASGVFFK